MFAKRSAENIIKLAETLIEADDKLSKNDLRKFCKEVGLKHGGSTYKKLMKIGEEVSRFVPFVGRMPNSWTTVYKLATLKEDKFDVVTKDNRFTPMTTAKDVQEIVGEPTTGAGHKLTIDLKGLAEGVKIEVYNAVKSLEEQFKFKLNAREEIKKLAAR